MGKKAARRAISKEQAIRSGVTGREPVNIFGCSDCELLIFEYPDVESTICPWCKKSLDVHATYAFVAFARGVSFSKTIGGIITPVIVE